APFDRGDVASTFAGGAVGYVGYESARWIERVPAAAEGLLGLPDFRLAFPSRFVTRDAPKSPVELVVVSETGVRPDLDGATREARRLEALGRERAEAPARPVEVRAAWTRETYLEAAREVRERIAAGDIYQANLSQRFDAAGFGDPFDVHLRGRRLNPAPFSAFLAFGESAVVSASPELFLRRRGRRVETRPIKGTRPRTMDESRDAAARTDLLSSAKDLAELAMIVDLERNDLSRVCAAGSVRVRAYPELETYATVFHLVAGVEGTLKDGAEAVDLLRATFPGGSITGCPKIRAIEILAGLEREPRGPCFGAIGWIGHAGDLDLNVAIRTIAFSAGTAAFRAGGGVVADSEPAAERAESIAKARALALALGDSGLAGRLA
ncbi:MAG TPA: anthranilate synthase component I family protein, partial [Planctomycetota bacterium]|nr:anthranilate synthase component I family protein [Planctomycetota bacterium]